MKNKEKLKESANKMLILTGLFTLAKSHLDALQEIENKVKEITGLGDDEHGFAGDILYDFKIDPIRAAKEIQKVKK